MKVLYDHQIYSIQKFGGINRYFDELMKDNTPNVTSKRIEPALFPVIPEPSNKLSSRGVRYIKRKIGLKEEKVFPATPPEVIDIFKKGDFDIFHPTYYDTYFLKYLNKPFVVTVYDMIHEVYKEYFDSSDNTSHLKKIVCEKADGIIAISENTKRDLIEIFKLPPEKIHAIPLASDFDKVIPSRPADLEPLDQFILFVGSRGIYKNFFLPVVALADFLRADKTLKLLCTGRPFNKDEVAFFEDLGITNQVVHLYLKDDTELAWAYRNAKLFIFPSLYEGFGFPLLEAFASDCPVIATRGGSLSEVGGDAVLYFDGKSISQIQDAANKALFETNTRKELIEKGRLQLKKFSWDKCREETLNIYKSILDNR